MICVALTNCNGAGSPLIVTESTSPKRVERVRESAMASVEASWFPKIEISEPGAIVEPSVMAAAFWTLPGVIAGGWAEIAVTRHEPSNAIRGDRMALFWQRFLAMAPYPGAS